MEELTTQFSFSAAVGLGVFVLLVTCFFFLFKPDSALLFSVLVGTLYLPQVYFKLAEGIPALGKSSFCNLVLLLFSLKFFSKEIGAFRPAWFDIPMLCWTICPFFSSIANELGAYDGVSAVISQRLFTWTTPYFLGRIVFSTAPQMRRLCLTWILGALTYIPLCWIEIRVSPQLHNLLYGFTQHSFVQTLRFGGYRPMVFLEHGLVVGFYMTSASLLAIWFWFTKIYRASDVRIGKPLVAVLIATTVAIKSTAIVIQGFGTLLLLAFTGRMRSRLVWVIVVLAPLFFVGARVSGLVDGDDLMAFLNASFGADRAESVGFRWRNENIVIERSMQRPLFGWGQWRNVDALPADFEEEAVVYDSIWMIALDHNGMFGVFALMLVLLLPIWNLVSGLPVILWKKQAVAPITGAAAIMLLYVFNCLLNAHVFPMVVVVLGSLATLAPQAFAIVSTPPVPYRKPSAPGAPDVAT